MVTDPLDIGGGKLPELPLPGDGASGRSRTALRPHTEESVEISPAKRRDVLDVIVRKPDSDEPRQVVTSPPPTNLISKGISSRDARTIASCSPYGELSLYCYHAETEGSYAVDCTGTAAEWGAEIPPALLADMLGVAQGSAPRRWGVVAGDPTEAEDRVPLYSVKEHGLQYCPPAQDATEYAELVEHYDSLRCGLRRPQGYRSGILCRARKGQCAPTRVISASHGDHPLCNNGPDGIPLDFIELEVRYSSPAPLEVALVLVGGDGGGQHLGTVSPLKRWWLNELRYPCCLHALRSADSGGGFQTICMHLSQLPPQVTAAYVTVHGELRETVALFCVLSSRPGGPNGRELRQQYCIQASRSAPSSAPSAVLLRVCRSPIGWCVGAIDVSDRDATTPAQLMPPVHNDFAGLLKSGVRATPAAILVPLVDGVSTEEMLSALGRGFGSSTAAQLAGVFNTFDVDRSGHLGLREISNAIEELYWRKGENPPPSDVIQARAERVLRKLDVNRDARVGLKEFSAVVTCDHFLPLLVSSVGGSA